MTGTDAQGGHGEDCGDTCKKERNEKDKYKVPKVMENRMKLLIMKCCIISGMAWGHLQLYSKLSCEVLIASQHELLAFE